MGGKGGADDGRSGSSAALSAALVGDGKEIAVARGK
jgi:hypothetical protein